MSLADELLADLEEGGEDLEQNEAMDQLDEMVDIDDASGVDQMKFTVRSVAKLKGSEELSAIMKEIARYQKLEKRDKISGPVEADPEYQLIVEANNITVEIDNEIHVIHKFVRDLYSKRFPELESLVPTPLEYVRTIRELGNDILENSKHNDVLQEILTPATIMVVSVTASTTQGNLLSDEELATIMEGCDMAIELNVSKLEIFDYVQSRMSFIAPNLSMIVGSSIAAKLMGVAGGLTKLSTMPSCNIHIIGSQKKTLSGFSSAAILHNTGFIYQCDIVQSTPVDLRKKATRLVSAKCTLAARVDSQHESVDGKVGTDLLAEITGKLSKLQEPPPVKTVKPLPAPIDAPRKNRGGRRARKMKERLGLTNIRKAATRMNFGEIEDDAYQEDLGFSLGVLGKSNSGGIRGATVDSKTKARISKTLQQKITKQTQSYGGSTSVKRHVAGTASSVAFTPLQGLEIVNPQAAENRLQEVNARYFSSTAGFHRVKTPLTNT